MPIPAGNYNSKGLKFVAGKREPYVVKQPHRHSWINKPRLGSNQEKVIKNKEGASVARFNKAINVTLLMGYSWDGSTGVFDTLHCARASALHDVWCKAMNSQIFENGWRNWRRGALEYRSLCRSDGMGWLRARIRYVLMTYVYGTGKKIIGKL